MKSPTWQPLAVTFVIVSAGLFCAGCSSPIEPQSNPAPANESGSSTTSPPSHFDVVIYGATPSGIMAAIQASRLGKNVMLIEPTHWIGGMVAGGLSETDDGTWSVIGGLALEFFQVTTALEKPRGGAPVNANGVVFNVEPHIARQVFNEMLTQANVSYRVDSELLSVQKAASALTQIQLVDGSTYDAKMFIDSSYEGDLMAKAGVPYSVGRESRSTDEPDAGVQIPKLIPPGIDPYKVAGDLPSGLLTQVSAGPAAPPGSADDHVMAYDYRFCVTDLATHAGNAIPFSLTMPIGYSEEAYSGAQRIVDALISNDSGESVAKIFFNPATVDDSVPGAFVPYADGKFDLNGGGPFSSDVVQIPDRYPDGDWTSRRQIAADIQSYDQGLFYFLATNSGVPSSVRNFVNRFGVCKDEFTDNANLPNQLYIREGRRMQGAYVMTEADVLNKVNPAPQDVIGMGGYNMDSHIHQILNLGGQLYVEGDDNASIGYGCTVAGICSIKPGTPFPIPYRALTPVRSDATNLLVSVTMSATSTAYRAIRLEPQYMIMGQAAGAAASLAIDTQSAVQDIPYAQLRSLLSTPEVKSQPAQILTAVLYPCSLKGKLYSSGTAIIGYKAVPASNTCTTERFTCEAGVWRSGTNVSPVPYYNTCANALSGTWN